MYGLGRNVSTYDSRDLKLSAYIRGVSDITEKIWPFTVDALNQFEKPHCGGFTMAHYGICHPMPSMYTNKDGDNFYMQCKITDLEPGMENGTSCRSMAVTGKKLGMWSAYAFATTMDEIDNWLLNYGSLMVGTEWCVSPRTKILTTNLEWILAENVTDGDEIIGFDENPNRNSCYRRSTVLSNKMIIRPSVEVITDRGSIIVSAEHQFIQRFKKSARRWIRADELKAGDSLAYMGEPWEIDKSWESGWLAGFYDGEGTLSRSTGEGRRHANVLSCIQKVSPTLDKALEILRDKGFDYTLHVRPANGNNRETVRFNLKGPNCKMRFLGSIRPSRLMENSTSVWEGHRTYNISAPAAIVHEVRNIGDQEVYAIKTSTATLITNGFLSHNCNDMFAPDKDNIIHPTGSIAGGHAWLLNGKIPGFKHGITSWGPDFGINGGFWIPDNEFEALFHQQGEAIAAVEIAKVDPSVVQSGCGNTVLGKALKRMMG